MSVRRFEELMSALTVATKAYDVAQIETCAAELYEMAVPAAMAAAEHARGMAASIGSQYTTALDHYLRALELFEQLDDRASLSVVHNHIGVAYTRIGTYTSALHHLHRALALDQECDNQSNAASVHIGLGSVHWYTGDYPLALEHYHYALAYFEERHDQRSMAGLLSDIGHVHYRTDDYPVALEYYRRSSALHEELCQRRGVAECTVSIGNVCYSTGDFTAALEHFRRGLAVHEELGYNSGIALVTVNIIGTLLDVHENDQAMTLIEKMDGMTFNDPDVLVCRELYRASLQERNNDLDLAATTLSTALSTAKNYGLRSEITDLHKALRDLALKRNDLHSYVEHNNEFTRLSEEVNGKDSALKVAMQAKQREIDATHREHQKHMAVLHSTLPKHIADRVARGEAVNDSFDDAAVLFLDVVGFTTNSSELEANVVVELLQEIFTTFDAICAEHNVMKIKTIGDSYMAVAFGTANSEQRTANVMPSGVEAQRTENSEQRTANVMPSVVEAQQTANSEQRIANVALVMMSRLFTWPHTNERVMFRIGIHCGPVVAGVLGTERMQYDVWGDTVNVASRMESTSEPGKIHVSEALANALGEHKNSPPDPLSHASLERGSHTVIPRGTVDVKGKGTMQTYWLEGTT